MVRRLNRRRILEHEESTEDLGPRDDRGRQARDAIGRLVAVQLEQERLRRVEDVDPGPEAEGRREHEPADRPVAEAAIDGAPDDRPDRGHRADIPLRLEPEIVHEAEGYEHRHPEHRRPDHVGDPKVRRLGDDAARHGPDEHRHAADDLGPAEDVLEMAGEARRLEGVDEPRLGGAREEREAESEQDRGDRPAPQRRVRLPHQQVEQRGEQERRGAEQVGEATAPGVGDDAGRDLEEHLPDREERVRREGLRVVQAGVEQEDRVDPPDERRRERREEGQDEIRALDVPGVLGLGNR